MRRTENPAKGEKETMSRYNDYIDGMLDEFERFPKSQEEEDTIVPLLKKNVLFSDFEEDELRVVANRMLVKMIKTDEVLITQGEIGDRFYLVAEGTFAIFVKGLGKVAQSGPGNAFGELSLLRRANRAATVMATSAGKVWALNFEVLSKLLEGRDFDVQISGTSVTMSEQSSAPRIKRQTNHQIEQQQKKRQELARTKWRRRSVWALNQFLKSAGAFFLQLGILVLKNIRILSRQRLGSLTFVVTPMICILMLAATRDATYADLVPDLATRKLGRLNPSNVYTVSGQEERSAVVVTVGYAPSGDADVMLVMRRVASGGDGLEHGFSNKLEWKDVVGYETKENLAAYIFEHPGCTEAAIVFQSNATPSATVTSYELWYNATHIRNQGVEGGAGFAAQDPSLSDLQYPGRVLVIQQAVDAAVLSYKLEGGDAVSAQFDASVGTFFEVGSYKSAFAPRVIRDYGATFLIAGMLCQAVTILMAAVQEKEDRIVSTLRRLGLTEMAYWVSYVIGYMVPQLVGAAFVVVLGQGTNLLVFKSADFGVHFMLYWLGCLAFSSLSLTISAPLQGANASIWSGLFCIFVIMFTAMTGMLGAWQDATDPGFDDVGTFFFAFFPFQHYGRGFDVVLRRTGWLNQAGSAFKWEDIDDAVDGVSWDPVSSSVGDTYSILVWEIPLFMATAWYLGQTTGSDGAAKPLLFFATRGFWGIQRPEGGDEDEGDTLAQEQHLSHRDGSVRVHKLSKVFASGAKAISELSVVLRRDAITALLGHNGAGKSTLINVLSGLTAPSFGEAYVAGLSVRDEMATLQRSMGTCPQYDTLWDELTAKEHLELVCIFKCIPQNRVRAETLLRLSWVGLKEVAGGRSKSFSGGMRRRISLSMASVGEPRLVFLDEPTTGMDPLNCRRVWDIISNLKTSRVVILTTHSMEEADLLGDDVAVMHQGRLKALGTPLYLKNTFSRGYEISILASRDATGQSERGVRHLVQTHLPGADTYSADAGALKVSMPKGRLKRLPALICALEGASDWPQSLGTSKPVLEEWGISGTTLEEVFLRLIETANSIASDSRSVKEESG